ncbi:hypothetical protein J4209_00535 [Candidatus Woesearchaeota archaeon]|nr:hypothetical protein [Candidatus Woesearchaeota archaeon]
MPEIPKCCEGCIKWEKFGKECWVYWEEKKNCTQHTSDWTLSAIDL